MLVEINLLPKKETRNIAYWILTGIITIVLCVGIFFFYYQGQQYDQKILSANNQIAATKQLNAAQQQKLTEYETSNSLVELEKAVKWAREYPIKSEIVLRDVTALLPERGYIQAYSYEESGTVKLSVQFDTSREAAYYLKRLDDANWVEKAKLNSLSTENISNSSELVLEKDSVEKKYVPRYIGEFEIELNRLELKNDEPLTDTSESEKEGGDPS